MRQVGVSNQGRSSSIAIGLPVLSHHFYSPSIAPLFTLEPKKGCKTSTG